MVRIAKIMTDLFNKKIWTITEFLWLSGVVALNPLIIVAVEYIFGVQFLTGFVLAWIILFAIKTNWRSTNV